MGQHNFIFFPFDSASNEVLNVFAAGDVKEFFDFGQSLLDGVFIPNNKTIVDVDDQENFPFLVVSFEEATVVLILLETEFVLQLRGKLLPPRAGGLYKSIGGLFQA